MNMLGKYQRCISCMKEIGNNNVCPYCGYIEGSPSLSAYLQPKTVLDQRYIVGKLLSYNGEGATYIAFDTVIEAAVEIREYMPDTLCDRTSGGNGIVVKQGCEAQYKALMSDFADLMRQLSKMRTLTTVVQVYEIFEQNNTVYAVFEHIDGVTLRQYLNENAGEIDWEEASKLFYPIFNTLAAVHSSNLIHRGISPENIIINHKGEIKLTGFSISPLRAYNTELSPQLFGGYAAPEQYSTNSWHGTWTDVYALSAVIYKALTGTMPPEATTRSVNDNLVAPHILNPSIPKHVSRAIMAGLLLSSEQRTQTVTELKNNLYNPEAVPVVITPAKTEKTESAPEEPAKKKLPPWAVALIITSSVLVVALVILFVLVLPGSGGNTTSSKNTSSETSSVVAESSASSAVVSDDNKNFAVPNFINKSWESIGNNDSYTSLFEFQVEYAWSDLAPGYVISQDPQPDTAAEVKSKVKLVVSKGSQYIKVPAHNNMSQEDYEAELRRNGIKSGVTDDVSYVIVEEENPAVTPGYVIRTSHDDGSLDRDKKEVLTVYVSKEVIVSSEVTSSEDDFFGFEW